MSSLINPYLVSYTPRMYGDFIVHLINSHKSFPQSKVKYMPKGTGNFKFPYITPYPRDELFSFQFEDIEQNLESCLNKAKEVYNLHTYEKKQFEDGNVQNKNFTKIAFKTRTDGNEAEGHSIWGWPWKTMQSSLFYFSLRSCCPNLNIVFVTLKNNNTKYTDLYWKRLDIVSDYNLNDFLNIEYPKHELNYVTYIDKILDYDEKSYVELCNFIKETPLNNWKERVKIYKKHLELE